MFTRCRTGSCGEQAEVARRLRAMQEAAERQRRADEAAAAAAATDRAGLRLSATHPRHVAPGVGREVGA